MNQNQTLALCGLLISTVVVQTVASRILLKQFEEMEKRLEAMHKGGLYLVSILEREAVELTEFDILALEAFRPNPS